MEHQTETERPVNLAYFVKSNILRGNDPRGLYKQCPIGSESITAFIIDCANNEARKIQTNLSRRI